MPHAKPVRWPTCQKWTDALRLARVRLPYAERRLQSKYAVQVLRARAATRVCLRSAEALAMGERPLLGQHH